MTIEEFEKYLKNLGPIEDLFDVYLDCKEDQTKIDEYVEFIEKNKIDCRHLWEDSEEGDNAHKNYTMLTILSLAYNGIDDLEYVPERYRENYDYATRKKVYDFLKRKNRI